MSVSLATLTQATGQSCTKQDLQLLEQKVVGTLEWHLLIATLPDWVLFFLHWLESQQSLDEQSLQNPKNRNDRSLMAGQTLGQTLGQTMGQTMGQTSCQMSQMTSHSMGQSSCQMGPIAGQSSLPFDLFFRCMDLCDRLLLDSDVSISPFLLI